MSCREKSLTTQNHTNSEIVPHAMKPLYYSGIIKYKIPLNCQYNDGIRFQPIVNLRFSEDLLK